MNEKKHEELVCSEKYWILNTVRIIVEFSFNKIESRDKTFCSLKPHWNIFYEWDT